ncbi:MAG: multiheme c-type cytochrome [Gammaproteobacteria bacterium]|nr:multiheme c-type cytochrome [Gammaproteobacteria bacterium]
MKLISRLILLTVILCGCSDQNSNSDTSTQLKSSAPKSASYVGSKQCLDCHQDQYESWQNSHHDLAMQHADEKTVLGNFDNTSFNYFGTVSRFYKKEDLFYIQTDGPNGKLTDYLIAYTFGVYPLQQYLIKFPKGRYQALNIVWDTRSKSEGGQRWLHLYPNEHIKHDDELHWTGINQNWNYMCADCHSTNLQKNYDVVKKEYTTTWSEIDVGCEACHGPASRHIAWSEKKNKGDDKGFDVAFNERKNASWLIDSVTGNAKRNPGKHSNIEIEACAQCHSRRTTLKSGARPKHALLNNFMPSLLTEPLYHADGQINGEVYVYGSFVQSKMYHAGVTCSDCHEPHSLKLRANGNALCAQCHQVDKYNSTEHHLHVNDTPGSQCVDCHMPEKNYMVIDARSDHSMRIPRPDLSVKLGVPNACSQCHSDKTAEWAAAILKDKNGKPTKKHFAEAIHAGRFRLPGAPQFLSQLILDETQPAIARATAVTLLPPYLSQQTAPVLQLAANDEKPLLGLGLANALDSIASQHRLPFAYPLLYDDSRSTRMLAGRSLLGVSLNDLPEDAADRFNNAIKEYQNVQLFNADRPESLVNLADFYEQQNKPELAEKYYNQAIELAPYFTPAYVNMANHYRSLGNDIRGEEVLNIALSQVRNKSTIYHALGLLKVRQKKMDAAVEYLHLAADSTETTDRYIYVYAIALNSIGKAQQALKVLEKAQHQYPTNTDILSALVSINKEQGDIKKSQNYEKILRNLIQ